MEQMVYMGCYHHRNCKDRPAVSRCSKCGKGLCRECTDNLKSEQTGKILCTDCLNEELKADAAWAERKKSEIKKEIIFIAVGFGVGLVVEIILAILSGAVGGFFQVLFILSLVLFLPTLFASFFTIVKKVRSTGYLFIVRVLYFIALCIISPVMFVWRIVKRAKDIKRLKKFAELQAVKIEANRKYANIAASMIDKMDLVESMQKARLLKEAAAERERAESGMAAYREQVDEKATRFKKQLRRESRTTDYVDSDEDAA